MQTKRETVYAFIDSQNLNYSISKDIYKGRKRIYIGWKVDMRYLHKYLKDKFRVKKIFLFIGYVPGNMKMYDSFSKFGYQLVFKPTVINRDGTTKGNVDAELVLHSCKIEYDNYDKSVVVSGDGDFYCLYEFLEKEKKLKNILIPNKFTQSSLLKRFNNYKIFLQRERDKLEFKIGRRYSVPRR